MKTRLTFYYRPAVYTFNGKQSLTRYELCLRPGPRPRDTVRFGYNHSILKEGSFLGREIKRGPRLSIMIRVGPCGLVPVSGIS